MRIMHQFVFVAVFVVIQLMTSTCTAGSEGGVDAKNSITQTVVFEKPPEQTTAPVEEGCTAEQKECAKSKCFPIGIQWRCFKQCLEGECKIKDQGCISFLSDDMYQWGKK